MIKINFEQILQKIIIICAFLVFLIPLIIAMKFFLPFIFPKAIVFRVLVEIMLICYLTLLFSNFKKYKPTKSGLIITTGIFVAIMILATVFSVDAFTSFWGTLERMEGLLAFLHYWVFFVILTVFFKKNKDWFRIFNLSILVGLLIDVYSVLQRVGWSVLVGSGAEDRLRVVGTIGNAAFLAAYLLLNCILILVMITKTNQKWPRLIYWLIFLFNIVVIYMTNTRGGLLALVVGLFIFTVLYFISFPRGKISKYLIAIFLIVAISISMVFVNKDKPWVKQSDYLRRISDISLKDGSIQARLMAWEIGWQAFKEKPLLGWGPENYNIPFNKYFKSEYLLSFYYTVWYDRAHNVVVEIASTMGAFGLASYLAIFVYLYFKLFQYWRRNKEHKERLLAIILATGIVAYFIQNVFIFDTINSYIVLFLIFAYVNFLLSEKKETILEKVSEVAETVKEKIIETVKPKKVKIWVLPILIAIAFIPFTRSIVHPVLANKKGAMGKAYFSGNAPDKAMELYKESFKYEVFFEPEILDHLGDGISKVIENSDFPEEKKVEYLEYVVKQNKKMLDKFPLNVRRYINTAKNHTRLATFKDREMNLAIAIDYLKEAVPLSPKRQRIHNELAFAYLRLGDEDKAISILKEVIAENDHIPEFHWNLFLTYEEIGEPELALASLEKAIERKYPFHNNIGAAAHVAEFYESLEKYEEAMPFYKILVELDPKNTKWYTRLAVLHAKLGNKEAAKVWALRTLEVDPFYQDQVKQFLIDLGIE